MKTSSLVDCYSIVNPLLQQEEYQEVVSANLTGDTLYSLNLYCFYLELANNYSKPMVWIGIYIAAASILCIIAMGADLLHGFRNKKMWFPSKYFTLNAASITVISVAMKLSVDLNTYMPSYLDQATKLGSVAFMCTMMTNLMSSLASMDNKTLLANVIGLVILVITIIGNICIQISTGVINSTIDGMPTNLVIVTCIYVAMLLWLLIITISSAITIPSYKRMLELKYRAIDKENLDDQDKLASMVDKLRKYVRRNWVMAESGSPQFVKASNPLSSTSGIICVVILFIELNVMLEVKQRGNLTKETTDYKWSLFFIYITQFVGVVIGSIAPICRCFTISNFNFFIKWNNNHFMIFKVEKYWIQTLREWKESHTTFRSGSSWSKAIVNNMKNLIIEICIGIQSIIVVSSKMMRLIPIVLIIFVVYGSYCWKLLVGMLFTLPTLPVIDDVHKGLRDYVLQLEDEMELSDRMLNHISNALDNYMIQKVDKEQNKDLMVFLDTSTGFNGVKNFDIDQVEHLTSVKLVNSWSLPVVTLTCIAISLPNISKKNVDRLLKNVREGLSYTHQVEEIINDTSEYRNIQKAAMTLWHEVEEKCMWLENTIEESAFRGKTYVEILEWFANKGKEIVLEINKTTNKEVIMMNTPKKFIVANSMYRTAQTILCNYQVNGEKISKQELFGLLSSMIADILCACFTNMPQVIKMKCRERDIEIRESSVKAAAKLFGRTEEILRRLEVWELPSMEADKMGFIDEWRHHLLSIP
ncbi:uncharacterized protein [Rutidosis leptorrhynchoides]|uniref:uncharacterized protein n=1 Tax=Rutidosis leptorrhynchoides TaxID=125765 RepID=UPI003A99C462